MAYCSRYCFFVTESLFTVRLATLGITEVVTLDLQPKCPACGYGATLVVVYSIAGYLDSLKRLEKQ